jgi:hypothetical protein
MIYIIYAFLAATLAAVFYRFYTPPETAVPSLDNQPVIAQVVPQTPAVSPKTPATAPIDPKVRLDAFCDALARFEGANPANHNRGNTRCSPVGYLPKYGKVLCNPHGFAVFPTDALGDEYLHELVHHRVLAHPTWNFYDFFSNYAPSGDKNDPEHYAECVATWCGTIPSINLASWLAGVA